MRELSNCYCFAFVGLISKVNYSQVMELMALFANCLTDCNCIDIGYSSRHAIQQLNHVICHPIKF